VEFSGTNFRLSGKIEISHERTARHDSTRESFEIVRELQEICSKTSIAGVMNILAKESRGIIELQLQLSNYSWYELYQQESRRINEPYLMSYVMNAKALKREEHVLGASTLRAPKLKNKKHTKCH